MTPPLFPYLHQPYRNWLKVALWLTPVFLGSVAAYLGLWKVTNLCLVWIVTNFIFLLDANWLSHIVMAAFNIALAIIEMISVHGFDLRGVSMDVFILSVFLSIASAAAFELGKVGQIARLRRTVTIGNLIVPIVIVGTLSLCFDILTGQSQSWYIIALMTVIPYAISYWFNFTDRVGKD